MKQGHMSKDCTTITSEDTLDVEIGLSESFASKSRHPIFFYNAVSNSVQTNIYSFISDLD